MDSLKEQTRPATKSSKPPHIEVDEEMVRPYDCRTGSYGFAGRYPAINFIKRKTAF